VIQQNNGYDCGIYAIHLARLWIRDGKRLMKGLEVGENFPYLNHLKESSELDRNYGC